MPTPDTPRFLPLSILLLCGLLIGLPWASGGRSPVGLVSLVLILVLAAAAGLFPRGSGPLLQLSPLLLLAGLLGAGSALQTIYPDRTVQSLLLLSAYLLAGTLAAHGARELPWGEAALLTAILASGLLVAGAGMLRLHQGSEVGLYARYLTGPFGYPNAMAGFLLLTGGAALAAAQMHRGPLVRGAAMLAGAVAMLGLFLTRSRGAVLAAGVTIGLWALSRRQVWWARRHWFALAGIGVLAALVMLSASGPGSGVLPDRFGLDGSGSGHSSLRWRWQILRWTWTMVRQHPWWGVGPGAFPVALNQYQRIPYVSGENPHNLYLELAAEYGLPAGLLAVVTLGGFLGRLGSVITRSSEDDPLRRRLAALLAVLVAFAIHSLVDLDWSFPAVALVAATLLGLANAHLRGRRSGHAPRARAWRACLILLLVAASGLALSRYYATTLVTWGRLALSVGDTASAERELTRALRLNPLGFSAHQWLARVRLLSRDLQGAVAIAERAVRIAPSDPNSLHLAGEMAAAAGRWDVAEARFRSAVDRAPFSQLRFYAGLVEAADRAGRAAEARWSYEQAVEIFSPERVLSEEARCLAPGDRYLLAHLSRIAARWHAESGDRPQEQLMADRAEHLAQPDPRGICATQGPRGQTSPEATAESFWPALAEGGWPAAMRYLVPELRRSPPGDGDSWWGMGGQPHWARVTGIASLHGGERQVTLRYEVKMETPLGQVIARCAQTDFRFGAEGWLIAFAPILGPESCRP
ncbi:MAG: O-antigen ligase family protein [candidate division NC10 bacterium]|nr:O-antigen ligase family protein [candidate division NC10 bacterium]